jgi:restriction endonuclease S subunit
LNNNTIIPEYLSILMNEALQSSYFKNRTRWTSLPSIQRKDVAEYRISIPTIQKQEMIIEVYNEYKKQIYIYDELANKKYDLMHSIILSSS